MYYENILIHSGSDITIQRQIYKSSEKKCLIQIFHTLFSILQNDKTNTNELCEGHFGYASIGKVIVSGKQNPLLEGQYVLLPPVFSKYIELDASCDANRSPYQIRTIPIKMDLVEALFIPVLCIAFHLLDKIEVAYEECKQVVIFGYTLASDVLHHILVMNKIDAVIVDESSSGKHKKCIYGNDYLENVEVSKIGQIVVFKQVFSGVCFVEKLKDINIKWIEVPCFAQVLKLYMRYDLFSEVVNYLRHNDNTFLQELVVQHVHAESVSQTCSLIEKYRFYGPCVVYDW